MNEDKPPRITYSPHTKAVILRVDSPHQDDDFWSQDHIGWMIAKQDDKTWPRTYSLAYLHTETSRLLTAEALREIAAVLDDLNKKPL